MGKLEAAPTGRLRVQVDSGSMFLSAALPVEIRDASQRLVATASSSSSIDVPAGLYSVDVVLPSGERARKVATVEEDAETELTFEEQPIFSDDATVREVISDVTLQSIQGAVLRSESPGFWEFEPEADVGEVPTATFSVARQHHKLILSLPVNPRGSYPLNACCVTATRRRETHTVRASFGPERRVASAINGVLESGEWMTSTGLFKQASDLLFHKYRDPSAAALGALTLHRLHQLGRRHQWVDNLSQGFPWLPDGPILLAALLKDKESEESRQRGLDHLLLATQQRPLYTDGLSLAMDLLRKWPDPARVDERRQRIDNLSAYTADADWESVPLLTTLRSDGV